MNVTPSDSFIDTLGLPHDDSAEQRRLCERWTTAYPCQDPIEQGFRDQALDALIEKRRLRRVRTTLRSETVRTAVLFFERAQEDDVARQLLVFNDSCEAGLRGLTRSAAGCRWAIALWIKLQNLLINDGTWHGAWKIDALQLMGVSARLDELYLSEEAFTTWLDCLVAQPNPKQKDIDRILDPMCIPKALQERDLTLWPGNPEESRARLHAIVDRELPRLRALEATLRVQYEEPARAAAQDMALAKMSREELALLRAERMQDQSYLQATAALLKVRKQAAAVPRPVVEAEAPDVDLPELAPQAGAWGLGPGEWGVGSGEWGGPGYPAGLSDSVLRGP